MGPRGQRWASEARIGLWRPRGRGRGKKWASEAGYGARRPDLDFGGPRRGWMYGRTNGLEFPLCSTGL